ncbi:MAG TPA: VapC toxin family PIN domain ribonuclease [Anaerolineaceae bacterium]|nr:VapC toxin family PIN domain ribonuclease [Anaerolineaceae bacterium]
MKVFIDTSAILAILNSDDHFHEPAKNEWIRIIESQDALFSSNYIIVETIALLQRRFGNEAVRIFITNFQPLVDLIWIDEKTHEAALSVVKTINQRDLSLVDCTSFEIMRQMDISHVFTFDSHFSEQGFSAIPKIG